MIRINRTTVLKFFVIVMLNIVTILLLRSYLQPQQSVDALSKIGSRGEEVRLLQEKLQERGLYTGSIDGIYGTQTEEAVKRFQRQQGLTVDGIAGSKTLKALGITSAERPTNSSISTSDFNLLARIISAEARGEPYSGQVAVGAVILNRVAHPSFPDTISGVIYQPGAFSCVNDGQINEPVSDSAYNAARDALNGVDPSGGAIYYYNPAKTSNQWIRSRPVITTIGDHVFAK